MERLTVAGLVLVRQRPGTATGVIFMTIEDETWDREPCGVVEPVRTAAPDCPICQHGWLSWSRSARR